MIDIVCYLWRGWNPLRIFLPEHVNTLAAALRRTLSVAHRFICVSDDSAGLDKKIEWLQTPAAAANLGKLQTLEGPRFPSCYRRLWSFSAEAKAHFGERILLVDIDLVPVRDLAPLLDREEDFVGWRPAMHWGKTDRVAGGLYLLRVGTYTRVFDDFDGPPAQALARRAGYRGSDQAWISYCLGKTAAIWPANAGIYSIRDMRNGQLPLPADARLVQFNGPKKPWESSLPWVREHWR